MRQILYYYYNVYFDLEKEIDETFFLRYNGNLYIFKKLDMDINTLKENITILNNYNINYHHIIINQKNELISTFQNKNYVLIKVEDSLKNNWVDFNRYEVDYHEIDLGKIWEQRIEYYMKIMKDSNISNLLTLSLFNYYIGMSENAISIANRLKNKGISLKRVLSHRRVKYPYDYITYYDPTEMILDVRIRDYSEYLKSKVIGNDFNVENDFKYLKHVSYSNDEMNILLARLLYPSYYYDLLDKMLENRIDEDILNKNMELVARYEKFLQDFYNNFSSIYNLYIIDWIKKKNL